MIEIKRSTVNKIKKTFVFVLIFVIIGGGYYFKDSVTGALSAKPEIVVNEYTISEEKKKEEKKDTKKTKKSSKKTNTSSETSTNNNSSVSNNTTTPPTKTTPKKKEQKKKTEPAPKQDTQPKTYNLGTFDDKDKARSVGVAKCSSVNKVCTVNIKSSMGKHSVSVTY